MTLSPEIKTPYMIRSRFRSDMGLPVRVSTVALVFFLVGHAFGPDHVSPELAVSDSWPRELTDGPDGRGANAQNLLDTERAPLPRRDRLDGSEGLLAQSLILLYKAPGGNRTPGEVESQAPSTVETGGSS